MLWMTAYHFCFDLNHFGYLSQSFNTDHASRGRAPNLFTAA